MSKSEVVVAEVTVDEKETSDIGKKQEKDLQNNISKLVENEKVVDDEHPSSPVDYDGYMPKIFEYVENPLQVDGSVPLKPEDFTVESSDSEKSDNDSKKSIDDSTKDQFIGDIKSTSDSTKDHDQFIDDIKSETTVKVVDYLKKRAHFNIEHENESNKLKEKLAIGNNNDNDFIEIVVDNDEFVDIPLDDNKDSTDARNEDEDLYATVTKTKKKKGKGNRKTSDPNAMPTYSTKWVCVTWLFTIGIVILVFVSFCGLAYFFNKPKKVYAPAVDSKTAYMKYYNLTEEDFEIEVHDNRTLARKKYPWNLFLWLPEPPSAKILG